MTKRRYRTIPASTRRLMTKPLSEIPFTDGAGLMATQAARRRKSRREFRCHRYAYSHSPRHLASQVVQILKTRFSSLRVHRIRKVWYALFDAQTRLGTA
jgi:hypothetical protein